MHTFFINTSEKSLNEYKALFDIQYEIKSLVSMDCGMSDWYDGEKGYLACVKNMGDMIDSYAELNNDFNLIIYIDLLEREAYSSIPRNENSATERKACSRAMQILYSHIMSETIVKQLNTDGREPQNVLIMFGEEKGINESGARVDDPTDEDIKKRVFNLLGIPDEKKIKDILNAVNTGEEDDKKEAFANRFNKDTAGNEFITGIREAYSDCLDSWFTAIIDKESISKANKDMFDSITKTRIAESKRKGIETASCPYDSHAVAGNKAALALYRLNIAIYLLKCINNNSIYEKTENSGEEKLIEFYEYSAEEIASELHIKKKRYSDKRSELDNMEKSFSDLKLAPELKPFDYERFALDKFGYKGKLYEIEEEDGNAKKGEGVGGEEKGGEISKSDFDDGLEAEFKREIEEMDVPVQNLFRVFDGKNGGYEEFDYCDDKTLNYSPAGQDDKKTENKKSGDKDKKRILNVILNINATLKTLNQYDAAAIELHQHHVEYFKRLRRHVKERLSNYSGRSDENKPALLSKRRVSMAGDGIKDSASECRYEDKDGAEDKLSLETIKDVSKNAYSTVIINFMKYCAGRALAVTDIKEHCDRFVTRIGQIKDSLKKLKKAAIGLLIAIIVLYIPFIVIQWEAITENVITIATAAASLAVPIALLYTFFVMAVRRQRDECVKAWEKLKKKSDEVLMDNAMAAKGYDLLLAGSVPSLRWVYEYKLDVEFYADCCKIARAKINHHKQKLFERSEAVGNIIKDLEVPDGALKDKDRSKRSGETDDVDYNISFCTGKNCEFYSIIDKRFLESVSKQAEDK